MTSGLGKVRADFNDSIDGVRVALGQAASREDLDGVADGERVLLVDEWGTVEATVATDPYWGRVGVCHWATAVYGEDGP